MHTKLQKKSLNMAHHMLKTISSLPIGTGYLAFRDIGIIIDRYIEGGNVLDFGCGAGRSSRLLKEMGLNVIGVDVSKDMIKQARSLSKDIEYILIKKNIFNNIGSGYNLIFISFVLMELSSKDEITNLIKKLSDLLAEKGKIIIISASDDFYFNNWLSIDTYSNQTTHSGDIVSVYLKDYDLTINDYLWRESDCEECFNQSDMLILDKLKPLGHCDDGKNWINEYIKAPFVIYILSK